MNGLKSDRTATVMVTHYKRLLNYIKPDFVHVMEARSLPYQFFSQQSHPPPSSPVEYPTAFACACGCRALHQPAWT